MLNRHDIKARVRAPRLGWALVAGPVISAIAALLPLDASAGAPPANSKISSVASATYDDAFGSKRIESNAVTTTVQQVYSHSMSSSQTLAGLAGGQVKFLHTLRNTGNGVDTYTLSQFLATNGAGLTNIKVYDVVCGTSVASSATAITKTAAMAQDTDACFQVVADVPASAAADQTSTIRIGAAGAAADLGNYVASSTVPTATQISNLDTATINSSAFFKVTQTISASAGPGITASPLIITVNFENTGSTAGTLTMRSLLGSPSLSLPNGLVVDTRNLCYAGVVAGAYTPTFTASTVSGIPGSTCAVSESGTLTLAATVPGKSSGTMSFKVNVKDATLGSEHTTHVVQYSFGTGTPVTGQSNAVDYRVVGPNGTALDIRDTVYGADTKLDDDANYPSAIQGTTQLYKLQLSNNTSLLIDDAKLSIAADTSPFPTDSILTFETEGGISLGNALTGPVTFGKLEANKSVPVVLRVVLPPKVVATTPSIITVTLTSAKAGLGFDTVKVTLGKIIARRVDISASATDEGLFNSAVAPSVPATANPTTTVTLPFTVTNPADQPSTDKYTLQLFGTYTHNVSAVDVTAPLQTGWTYTIRANGGTAGCAAKATTPVADSGIIPIGGKCDFVADIVIPGGSAAGDYKLYVRAISAAFGIDTATVESAFDVLSAKTTVNTYKSLQILGAMTDADATLTTTAGGYVEHLRKVCNLGNVANSKAVLTSVNSDLKYSNTIVIDSNADGHAAAVEPPFGTQVLAAGQCLAIVDLINTPVLAAVGDSIVTKLTLTATWPDSTTTTSEARDLTLIKAGDLTAVKTQASIAVDAATWPAVFSKDPLGPQVPGAVIAYEVTITNVGSAAATKVIISDAAPAFTTLYTTGKCAPKLDIGGTAGAVPTVSGQNVTGTVGTLNGKLSAKLTFCARLNQ